METIEELVEGDLTVGFGIHGPHHLSRNSLALGAKFKVHGCLIWSGVFIKGGVALTIFQTNLRKKQHIPGGRGHRCDQDPLSQIACA